MHPVPERVASVVAGQYPKLSDELPAGRVIVWLSVLSPSGSAPDAAPSSALPLPLWALLVVADGGAIPPAVHRFSPLSNPPFCTNDAPADGDTELEAVSYTHLRAHETDSYL